MALPSLLDDGRALVALLQAT